MKTKSKPTSTDAYIGKRVRDRRAFLGVSQVKLGQAVGKTFQQIQKYERGTNRIAGGALGEIAHFLGVTPNWFYPATFVDPSIRDLENKLISTKDKIRAMDTEAAT